MRSRVTLLFATAILGTVLSAHGQEPPAEPAVPAASPAPAPSNHVSRLQGMVYLARNRPVVGGVVVVRPKDDASRVWLTSTDEKGVLRIEALHDGSYDVRLEREGLEPVLKSDVPLRFPFRAVVELAMKPLAQAGGAEPPAAAELDAVTPRPIRFAGVVQDVARDPIAEARVRIVDTTGRTDPRVATTGSDGAFRFDDLPAGAWAIQVRAVGRLAIHTRLDLGQDTSLEAILVQQPATYVPSPLELMPPEEPIVPEAFRPAPLPTPAPQLEVRTAK